MWTHPQGTHGLRPTNSRVMSVRLAYNTSLQPKYFSDVESFSHVKYFQYFQHIQGVYSEYVGSLVFVVSGFRKAFVVVVVVHSYPLDKSEA